MKLVRPDAPVQRFAYNRFLSLEILQHNLAQSPCGPTRAVHLLPVVDLRTKNIIIFEMVEEFSGSLSQSIEQIDSQRKIRSIDQPATTFGDDRFCFGELFIPAGRSNNQGLLCPCYDSDVSQDRRGSCEFNADVGSFQAARFRSPLSSWSEYRIVPGDNRMALAQGNLLDFTPHLSIAD